VRTATTVGNEAKLRAGLYDEYRFHTHAMTPFLTNNSDRMETAKGQVAHQLDHPDSTAVEIGFIALPC
jgi:hypothetical protein